MQTPLGDILKAADALDVQIVAIGFSGCLNLKQMQDGLVELRAGLPEAVQLWAGGSTPGLQRRPMEGVQVVASLSHIHHELRPKRPGA